MFKNLCLTGVSLVLIGNFAFAQTPAKKTVPAKEAQKAATSSKSAAALTKLTTPNVPAATPLAAQPVMSDPVLMTVGGDPVTKAEFESIYRKNNPKDAVSDKKALEEYLELFINFKLKVKAAKDAGNDTAKAFQNELKGYRRQLALPYLSDKEVNEKLIEEAYERMKKDVKASHILIKLVSDPTPKDTLAAYNKAMALRARALKGENFNELAKQNSDDPSASQNAGDLGYFTSMMMVYPFESAAYNTAVNQVTMPVRTKYGYHILKTTDIRDAQGEVHVAHIMVKLPENPSDSVVTQTKKKADEIYGRVKAGEDFSTLASTYSDDRTSGKNGGQLPWFGPGKMVPEFEKASFELKENNDVTPPIRTQYGFHIIKRLDRKGIQSFDEVKSELKQKISKDSRSQVSKNAVIDRVKKESGFTEDAKALNALIAKVDTSYLNGKWSLDKAQNLNMPLFTMSGEATSQAEFAKFISDNQTRQPRESNVEALVRKAYEGYKNDKIIAFEDARLESKYPEFRLLMQEYRDGILLFEITDENVWSKAIRDSAGLATFYDQNKFKYMWGERTEAVIYKAKDAKTAKATRKLVAKRAKKGTTVEDIKKVINETSQLNLQTEEGAFSKADNESVDRNPWVAGISPDYVAPDGSVTFVEYRKVLEPQPKTLAEARGMITADYQNYLEQEWIKSLRAKYKVEVDRKVFETIK